MDFEDILKGINSMGRYQMFVVGLVFIINIGFLLINTCFLVFAGLPYPRSCLTGGAGNESFVNASCEYFQSAVTEWHLEERNLIQVSFLLNSVTMGGFLVGALLAGVSSDKWGRKKVWCGSTFLLCLSGGLSGLCPDWESFAVFRFFVGIFASSYTITALTFSAEITSKSHRVWILGGYILAYELGFAWFAALAYVLRDWRMVTMLANVPILLFILLFFFIYESPRWLLQTGPPNKAREVLKQMAKRNGCILSEDVLRELPTEKTDGLEKSQPLPTVGWSYLLKSRTQLKKLASLSYIAFVEFCVFYGILFNAGSLVGENKYLNVTIFGLIKILPFSLTVFADRRLKLGRRTLLLISQIGVGVCMGGITVMEICNSKSQLLLNTTAIAGSCFTFPGVLMSFLYPAEVFPTLVRNRAVGVTSTGSRIGSILAPQILYLSYVWSPLPSLVFSLLSLSGAVVAITCLPETRGKPLPEIELKPISRLEVQNTPGKVEFSTEKYDTGPLLDSNAK